jgi:hypothetical protein
MNPFEFVIAALFLVFAFAIVRHKLGIPDPVQQTLLRKPADDQENTRLRQQVQQLQERIRVLERIVTDGGVQTAAQIEALREQDRNSEKETNA